MAENMHHDHNLHVMTTSAPDIHTMHHDLINMTVGGYSIVNNDNVIDAAHSHHVHAHAHNPPAFHTRQDDIILFEGWKLSPGKVTYLSCLALVVAAVLYQALKTLRTRIGRKCHNIQCKRYILAQNHLIQTILYVVQFIAGYFVMLAVMTYNVWIVIATVSGLGLGYFFFGWKDYERVKPASMDPVKPRQCAGDKTGVQELQPLSNDGEDISVSVQTTSTGIACSCDHTLL